MDELLAENGAVAETRRWQVSSQLQESSDIIIVRICAATFATSPADDWTGWAVGICHYFLHMLSGGFT
jgi:hypothetical protein